MSAGLSDLDRLRLLSDALRVFVPGAPQTPALAAAALDDPAETIALIRDIVGPIASVLAGPRVNVAQPTAEECAEILAVPKKPGFFSRLSAWLSYDNPPAPSVRELPVERATMVAAIAMQGPRNRFHLAGGVVVTSDGALLLVKAADTPPIPRLGGRILPTGAVAEDAWDVLSTRVAVTEHTVSRSDGSGYSYDDVVRTKSIVSAHVVPLSNGNLPDGQTALLSAILPSLERSLMAQVAATPTTARPQLPSPVLKPLLLSPNQEMRLAATQWVGEWGQARRAGGDSPAEIEGTRRGGR